MKLDYGTMISPCPICLTVGTIRKPKLVDIADSRKMGFDQFKFLESMMSITPKDYYEKFNAVDSGGRWEQLSDEEKESMTMFQAITEDENLQQIFLILFQFFFEEPVDYHSGFFIILKPGTVLHEDMTQDDIVGVLDEKLFRQVLSILKQICGMKIDDEEFEDIPDHLFKNAKARALYERMKNNKVKEHNNSDDYLNYTLPNVISKICARHPSINYTNVWELTIYELLDNFNSMRAGAIYDIDQTRVSVWGDEHNTFKLDSWYKNEYDKKND